MKRLAFSFALAAAASTFATPGAPALAQTRDCPATVRAWNIDPRMPKNCTCPCDTCEPQCPNSFAAPATPWSGTTFAKTPNAFAAQMAASLISQMFAAAFAPIEVDASAIEAQRAADEAAAKKAEAMRKKLVAEWEAEQKQAAKEREEAKTRTEDTGRDLLGKMHDVGGIEGSSQPLPGPTPGGKLERFKWETTPTGTPRLAPLSRARYDTSGLRDWQRALCAAYLSQTALSAVRNDLDRARYFNEQAALAMAGQPIEVACTFPKMPDLPEPGRTEPSTAANGPSMAMAMKAFELIQARAMDLQGIDIKLRTLLSEKSDAAGSRQQADAAVAQAQAAKAQAKPDDAALMAEIQRRLAEALRQRDEADRKLDAVTHEIDELYTQKESIRQELQAVQQQVQAGSAG